MTSITIGSVTIKSKCGQTKSYMLGKKQYEAYVKYCGANRAATYSDQIKQMMSLERRTMWDMDLPSEHMSISDFRNNPTGINVSFFGATAVEINDRGVVVTKLDGTVDSYSDYVLSQSPDKTQEYIQNTMSPKEVSQKEGNVIKEIQLSIDKFQSLIDEEVERKEHRNTGLWLFGRKIW